MKNALENKAGAVHENGPAGFVQLFMRFNAMINDYSTSLIQSVLLIQRS
jgi:hypothetical protein